APAPFNALASPSNGTVIRTLPCGALLALVAAAGALVGTAVAGFGASLGPHAAASINTQESIANFFNIVFPPSKMIFSGCNDLQALQVDKLLCLHVRGHDRKVRFGPAREDEIVAVTRATRARPNSSKIDWWLHAP